MSELQKASVATTEETKVIATTAATSKVVNQAADELANDDLDKVSGGRAPLKS